MKLISNSFKIVAFLALTPTATAAEPAWWAARGVTTADPASNFSPATLGQAKWMAHQALETLQSILPDVASQIDGDLTSGSNPILQNGWTVPLNSDENLAVLTIGQLKALAHPFHARLSAAVGNSWMNDHLLSRGLPASAGDPGLLHGDFLAADGVYYPWKLVQSPENRAIANLGQLKLCFDLPLTEDSESPPDGLPDLWEYAVVHANPPGGTWTDIGLIDAGNAAQAAADTAVTELPNSDTQGGGSEGETPDWLTLTGNGAEKQAIIKTQSFTIKRGKSRMLVVGMASEEYPLWTSDQSKFNDLLKWEITSKIGPNGPDKNVAIDLVDVNTLHGKWELASIEGTSLQGFSPAHMKIITVIKAPAVADVTVTVTLTVTNIGDELLPSTLMVGLLPVDLDIVHPANGELADGKEDIDDGGNVSVQRLEDPADATSDVTPKTKLKIHAVAGAQATWKTRLKFSGADRFKVYRDEARTQEVVSEQTEFDATQDTTLFFPGLKKSLSRGGETITMQVKVGNDWVDGDSVKCTIVQSEFLVQVKAFIPYAWTEGEPVLALDAFTGTMYDASPLAGIVAKGDLHPGLGDRLPTAGFINEYSTDKELPSGPVPSGTSNYGLFKCAPFRVCQTVIITPYKELHPSYDISSARKVWTSPLSELYVKATSVDSTELALHMGFKSLAPAGLRNSGKPPINVEDYRQGAKSDKIAELHIEAGAKDGAMGSLTSLTPDVHWDMWVKVLADSNPLVPTVQYGGKHDSYPAYEIIVIQSDGTYKPIHNVSPAAGARPGPTSLSDINAINIGSSETIAD